MSEERLAEAEKALAELRLSYEQECRIYDEACVRLDAAEKALSELLRLYDWRFELAEREGLEKRNPALSDDFRAETARLLRQYGAEKKAAWEEARKVLKR